MGVVRALSVKTEEPPKVEEQFKAGSDYATAGPTRSAYDPIRAASALVANPWYWRATWIKAQSSAALPLQIQRQDADGKWVEVPDHPLQALLKNPNKDQTELQFRQQMVVDYCPGGNAYMLPLQAAKGRVPTAVLLLEPARVKIVPGEDGSVIGYEYDEGGATTTYAPTDVVHIKGPSAGKGIQRLYGTGEVQPMHLDIESEVALSQQATKKSQKGRPDAAYVPRKDDTVWSRDEVRDMRVQLDRQLQEDKGGIPVMSGAGRFETNDWSPSDLALYEGRAWNRSTSSAVTGVPPTMLGLQSANYATAEMERESYNRDTLTPLCGILDDALTEMARVLGFPDIRFKHILPEKQDGRSERLARVQIHKDHGMDPADAYRYEGFDDVPALASFAVPDGELPALPDGEVVEEAEPAPTMTDDQREDLRAQMQALESMLVDDDPDEEDDVRTEAQALLDLLKPLVADDS